MLHISVRNILRKQGYNADKLFEFPATHGGLLRAWPMLQPRQAPHGLLVGEEPSCTSLREKIAAC